MNSKRLTASAEYNNDELILKLKKNNKDIILKSATKKSGNILIFAPNEVFRKVETNHENYSLFFVSLDLYDENLQEEEYLNQFFDTRGIAKKKLIYYIIQSSLNALVVFYLENNQFNLEVMHLVKFLRDQIGSSVEIIVYFEHDELNDLFYSELVLKKCNCISPNVEVQYGDDTDNLNKKYSLPIPESSEETIVLDKANVKNEFSNDFTTIQEKNNIANIDKNTAKPGIEPRKMPGIQKSIKRITKNIKRVKLKKKRPEIRRSITSEGEATISLSSPNIHYSNLEKTLTYDNVQSFQALTDAYIRKPTKVQNIFSNEFPDLKVILLLDSLGHYWKKFVQNLERYCEGKKFNDEITKALTLLQSEIDKHEYNSIYRSLLGDLKNEIIEIAEKPFSAKVGFMPLVKNKLLVHNLNKVCDLMLRFISLFLFCIKSKLNRDTKIVIAKESEKELALLFENCSIPCRKNPENQCCSKDLFKYFRLHALPTSNLESRNICCKDL